MKSLGLILTIAAIGSTGIVFAQSADNSFGGPTAQPTAQVVDSGANPLPENQTLPAGAEQNGEEQEPPLLVKVYEVGDLMLVEPPSYPARRLDDLGDGRSLFAENSDASDPSPMSMGGGMGGMGGPAGVHGGGCMNTAPEKPDGISDIIMGVVAPSSWDQVGGNSSIKIFGDLLIISTTEKNHAEITALLGKIREHIISRKTVVIETHWLWLTPAQLNKLVPNPAAAVDEKAWEEHQKQLAREDSDIIPGYHAVVACLNGQTVSASAGRQRRFVISLIPVVGDDGTVAPSGAATPAVGATESRGVGYQPQSCTVQEGAALQVRPMLCGDDQVLIDIHSRVVEVETPEEPANPPANQAVKKPAVPGGAVQAVAEAVDRPVVNTSRIDATFRAPLGTRTLVGGITGSTRPEPDEPSLYLFAKVTMKQTAKNK